MRNFRFYHLLLIYLLLNNNLFGSNTAITGLSTVKSRSIGMGGAFVSIRDDLAALDFNPAGFSIDIDQHKPRVSFYLNPVGPVTVLNNINHFQEWDEPIGLIIHGISLSAGKLRVGILLGEETMPASNRKKPLFNIDDYAYRRNSTFGFSLALAPHVSLGLAGDLYKRLLNQTTTWKLGYRYGVVLTTQKKITVGLCYCDFPKNSQADRIPLERLADESLNIGISYTPWKSITLALDVRNVSEEERDTVREPHFGIEIQPHNHFAFRLGYYQENGSNAEIFSAGLGIFNGNMLLSEENRFNHASFIMNCAMIWRIGDFGEERSFILSSIIRL